MDPEMQKKIDEILLRVKEPETLEPVGNLNLVQRVSYSGTAHRFLVTMDIAPPRTSCFVCNVVTGKIRETIERDLGEAFSQAFPGCTVDFA